MQAHALFPTLVLEEKFHDHFKFKQVFEKNVLSYFNEHGVSYELIKNDLHFEPDLEPIYVFATQMAKAYVGVMALNPEIFDYYIPKSWLNVIDAKETPMHNHGEVTLSFVYYVNIPKGKDRSIVFHDQNEKKQLFPDCIRMHTPKEWNLFNSLGWSFTPTEGTMFMFPGQLNHSTEGIIGNPDRGVFSMNDYRDRRVAIAGDIVLVYKNPMMKFMGHQPLIRWRLFGENKPSTSTLQIDDPLFPKVP